MSAEKFLVIIAASVIGFVTGCTTPDPSAATESDPMLQKSTDEQIHGEVGAFYGHSVGH